MSKIDAVTYVFAALSQAEGMITASQTLPNSPVFARFGSSAGNTAENHVRKDACANHCDMMRRTPVGTACLLLRLMFTCEGEPTMMYLPRACEIL